MSLEVDAMGESDDLSKDGSVKIVDRRRFSEDGARPGENGDSEKPSSAPSGSEAPNVNTSGPRSSHHYEPVSFSSFIVGLAAQCMMLLGEMPDPRSGQASINLNGARETIDLLGLLEEKTKGNLSREEQHLLSEVLASLRLAYVNRSRDGK